MYSTDDLRITDIQEVTPPVDVRRQHPLTERGAETVHLSLIHI